MEFQDLTARFSQDTRHQQKAIFSSLFILGNRLQTLFDSHIPELSLKQFMLLTIARQWDSVLTFTQLGELLGCSRQNIKKLAEALERKGFVTIQQSPRDTRAMCVVPTERTGDYFTRVFPIHEQELSLLFNGYSPEEVAELFRLLTKLYNGIDRLERSIDHG